MAIFALIILITAGGGGYFYFFKLKHPNKNTEITVPKPILFAQISNLVVSVPETADSSPGAGGSGNTSSQVFIEISIQFSTNNQKAIDSFNALEPIVQAKIVDLLMKKTAMQIMNPNTHNQLCLSFLTIANDVLDKNQDFSPANPFLESYITNIVQQD